jgi:glutathione S-transferase
MHELTGIAFSHYVEKARWALERFAVPYRDRRVLPFFHFAAVYQVHGGRLGQRDKVSTRFSTPVLRTDDGRVLCDSAEILRYVSDRFAPVGLGLHPTREASELEQRFHDQLGPHTRRAAYGMFFAKPELLLQVAENNVSKLEAKLFATLYPVVKGGLSRALGVNARNVERSVDKTRRVFDEVSARLADGRPFLLGDSFSAADLTFAALGSPAVVPPEYSAWLPPLEAFPTDVAQRTRELRETPAGAFIMRLFREERRRVVRDASTRAAQPQKHA